MGIAFMLAFGLSALLATAQIYLRDTKNILPFVGRFLLYSSPILYLPENVPDSLSAITVLNPAFGLVSAWSEAIVMGQMPTPEMWITSIFWALFFFLIGTYLFLSREREFSVRI
jgi:teichoic acid transport system permease protein